MSVTKDQVEQAFGVDFASQAEVDADDERAGYPISGTHKPCQECGEPLVTTEETWDYCEGCGWCPDCGILHDYESHQLVW